MRISDWSSDVCSSDLSDEKRAAFDYLADPQRLPVSEAFRNESGANVTTPNAVQQNVPGWLIFAMFFAVIPLARSEEHTSELQSLMRISYAVFCLKKKKKQKHEQYYSSKHYNIIEHAIVATHNT